MTKWTYMAPPMRISRSCGFVGNQTRKEAHRADAAEYLAKRATK